MEILPAAAAAAAAAAFPTAAESEGLELTAATDSSGWPDAVVTTSLPLLYPLPLFWEMGGNRGGTTLALGSGLDTAASPL